MSWYNFKKAIVSWVADIRIYPGGIILFGDSHYHLKGKQMREIMNVVQPGDVLLRRYSHYLGSVTIPGYWSHAAVYVGSPYNVIHMLGEGITIEDILIFMRCDDVCVLRHKDESIRESAIDKAFEQLEKKVEYDYDFDTDVHDKFYCTEFVEYCFNYPNRDRALFEVKSILPDAFIVNQKFDVVWQDPKHAKKMSKKIKC